VFVAHCFGFAGFHYPLHLRALPAVFALRPGNLFRGNRATTVFFEIIGPLFTKISIKAAGEA